MKEKMEILKIKQIPELLYCSPSFREKVEKVTNKFYKKRSVSLFISELIQTYDLENAKGANRMVRLKVLWAVKVFNYLNKEEKIKKRKPKQLIRYSKKLLSKYFWFNPNPSPYLKQLHYEFIFLTEVEKMYYKEQEEMLSTRYSFLQVRPKEQLVHGKWEKCCSCYEKPYGTPKETDENPFCHICSKDNLSKIALFRLGFPIDIPHILERLKYSNRKREFVHQTNLLMAKIRNYCISEESHKSPNSDGNIDELKIGDLLYPKVGQNEVEDFSTWNLWDFWINGWKRL